MFHVKQGGGTKRRRGIACTDPSCWAGHVNSWSGRPSPVARRPSLVAWCGSSWSKCCAFLQAGGVPGADVDRGGFRWSSDDQQVHMSWRKEIPWLV